MKITIEMIDELRKRANVSFEDAKMALEKYEGDLVEALVYLEKQNMFKAESAKSAESAEKTSFSDNIKKLIEKGNNTRFIISKKGRTVLNLSLTISIIVFILAFHITAIALVIALFAGYKFRFEKNNGEDMKVNAVLNKVHDNVENFKNDLDKDKTTENK